MIFVVPTLLSAFCVAVVLTWVVRKLARVWAVVDRPDGIRKLHARPTPLLGGVGVFGAWLVGMMVGSWCFQGGMLDGQVAAGAESGLSFPAGFGLSMILAACVVVLTGILDDLYNLRPRWKLVGQAAAASILVANGLTVQRLWLFGSTVDLGWLGVAFSIVWLVGSMNSVNMLDGLDGLASSLGLVICITLTWMAWLTDNASLGLVAMALAGSLAGFLVFNYPPASIYLGDSGSMLIGLVIGAVAIKGSFKAPATAALVAPVAILAVPIVDGLEAVIRRRISGRGIYTPDRGHIHHCLQRFGWSSQQILAGIGILCAITGSGALLSLYMRNEPIALAASLGVGVGCTMVKLFGNLEYREILRRAGLLAPPELDERKKTAA